MNSSITQIDIEAFSSAMGINEWKKEEFIIFEGIIPPPRLYTPVRLDYYSFLFLESGLIRNIVDLQPHEIKKNDILFLNPSQILQVEFISPDAKGKLVAFEKSFLIGEQWHLLEKLRFFAEIASPVLSLTRGEAENIVMSMREIKRKTGYINRSHRRLIAVSMITSLLLEIDVIYRMRHVSVEKVFSRKELVNNHFHSLLSAHFLHERSVRFYADLLSITPKYLTELSKELTGKTAGELIDDRVILEAKVLLQNPELSIKRIAEILHFSDQFFFSKYFKNFAGISPSQYRNQEN